MAAMRNALQNPPVPLNVARAVPPASLPAANAIPAVLANPLHPLIPMLERLLVGESAPAQGFNGNIRAPIALPEHKLVAVLLARCSIDPNPVLSYQLRKLPLYKLQLTASAWQRVLDELIISGLLGNGLNGFTCTLSQLDARLRQLQILNPEKLVIADADVLDLWPPVLVAPPGPPAPPAGPPPAPDGTAPGQPVEIDDAGGSSGQPGEVADAPAEADDADDEGAAVPLVPAMVPPPGGALPPVFTGALRLLEVVTIDMVVDAGPAPLGTLGRLVGALGGASSRAACALPGSAARRACVSVTGALRRGDVGADGSPEDMAGEAHAVLAQAMLPFVFRSGDGLGEAFTDDLRDGLTYCGGDRGRRQIEETRIRNLAAHFPKVHQFLVQPARTNGEALALIQRACRQLIDGEGSINTTAQPLVERLPALEAIVAAKGSAFELAAAQPDAQGQPAAALEAVLAQTKASRPDPGGGPTGSLDLSGMAPASLPNAATLDRALDAPNFQAMAADIMACETETSTGRLRVLGVAGSGQCALFTRVLALGEPQLVRRHAALQKVHSLRPYAAEYLSACVVMDVHTGQRPARMTSYSICGPTGSQTALIDDVRACRFSSCDWLGSYSEPGLFHFKSALENQRIAAVHAQDRWCTPAVIEQLMPFGQTLLEAVFGLTGTVKDEEGREVGPAEAGYTWTTWWSFYVEHVKLGARLPGRPERFAWLRHANDQALLALRMMGELLRTSVTTMDVEQLRHWKAGAMLPFDAPPAVALRQRAESFGTALDMNHMFGLFNGAAAPKATTTAFEFMLLSSEHKRPGAPAGDPKSKKLHAGDADDGAGLAGRHASAHLWLAANATLLISGLVWDVKGLSAHLNVKVGDVCWPYHLTKRNQRLASCDRSAQAAHATDQASAHACPALADPSQFESAFSRPPTTEERKKLPDAGSNRGAQKRPQPGSRGRGRGGRGRGGGRAASSVQGGEQPAHV